MYVYFAGPKQTKNVDVFLEPLVESYNSCGEALMMFLMHVPNALDVIGGSH